MNQFVTSRGGFRFLDMEVGSAENNPGEPLKTISTQQLLDDLEKEYLEYMDGKDSWKYMEVATKANEFFSRTFTGLIGLLETQVTNAELSGIGWDYLTLLVEYAIGEATLDKDDIVRCKELDRMRSKLSNYFVSKSFLTDPSKVDESTLGQTRMNRLEEIKKSFKLGGARLSVHNTLMPTLCGDRILMCETLRLLLFPTPGV